LGEKHPFISFGGSFRFVSWGEGKRMRAQNSLCQLSFSFFTLSDKLYYFWRVLVWKKICHFSFTGIYLFFLFLSFGRFFCLRRIFYLSEFWSVEFDSTLVRSWTTSGAEIHPYTAVGHGFWLYLPNPCSWLSISLDQYLIDLTLTWYLLWGTAILIRCKEYWKLRSGSVVKGMFVRSIPLLHPHWLLMVSGYSPIPCW
jgi:hypothetical protein